jgi:SAM-dependent methyltransferase
MIPKWKYWLSHFFEVKIETIRRNEKDVLHVSLKKGRLMLSTDYTIYSWDDLYRNYLWAFEKIYFDKFIGNRALLLGMGLGAVPFLLEHRFKKDFYFTAVEIDPDVVRLAKKYGLPRIHNIKEIICSDATEYVFRLKPAFDLIIIDICREDLIPQSCESIAFLNQIKYLLGDSGVLLYNRFYSTYKDHFRTDRFYRGTFKTVFPQGCLIDQNGTCMLVNDIEHFNMTL